MSKKNIVKQKSLFHPLIAGVLSGISAAIITTAAMSLILVKKDIPYEYVKYLWIVISIIAGFITGITTARHIRKKGIIWGGISAGITSLIIIALVLVVNKVKISAFSLLIIPICLLSGAVGGIISRNLRR